MRKSAKVKMSIWISFRKQCALLPMICQAPERKDSVRRC